VSLALTSRRAALMPGQWVRNELWRRARAVPSLDLRFADNKNLTDAVTGASLITFTRASSGTFVDSAGVLQSAVTNLLLRSEEFNDASWTKVNTTVTANSIAAPNGTVTADTITDSNDGTTVIHSVTTANQSLTSGLTYTISVYAKAGTQPGIAFVFSSTAFTSNLNARFNISTGTISSLDSGITGSITAVGDGWYRCSATATATATASVTFQIRIATASTSFYQGNGTGTIYLWGAQLEQAATVGEYIPTTSTINSAPRFDHNPTTGESLGLLVEEARTNLVLRSEEFDSGSWTKIAATVTADAIVSPSGALNADKLVETTANSTHYAVQSVSVTTTSRTASIYLKAGERTQARIEHSGNTGGAARRLAVNLSTGVITSASTIGTGGLNSFSESIVSVGDGWYRIISTIDPTVTSGNTQALVIQILDNTGQATYTGNGTSGIYLWGAQLEAGAFPTSYIPTTTATATRSADVASITGSNFSSWYRQDEGTVFAESAAPSLNCNIVGISDGTGSNRVLLDTGTNNKRLTVTVGGVAQAGLNRTYTYGVVTKTAAAVKQDSFQLCEAGSLATEDTSGTMPAVDRLNIGSSATAQLPLNGTIKRLVFWPTRLANNVLQEVTR